MKCIVPKFANGSTLHVTKQLEGASATHSAEASWALVEVCVVVNVHRRVVFFNTNVKVVPETETRADMLSPARTGSLDDKVTEAAGYISYQA